MVVCFSVKNWNFLFGFIFATLLCKSTTRVLFALDLHILFASYVLHASQFTERAIKLLSKQTFLFCRVHLIRHLSFFRC